MLLSQLLLLVLALPLLLLLMQALPLALCVLQPELDREAEAELLLLPPLLEAL